MITFSRFGKKGNLGNQMFHLAGMLGFSKKYNQELRMPNWSYKRYFNGLPYIISETIKGFKQIVEDAFHYDPGHWDPIAKGDWDVNAWLQTEKLWDHCKDDIKAMFTWNENFRKEITSKIAVKDLGNSIAISVRRGDYVKNENYDLLPISYYMQALMAEFPDYLDRQILIFSDDIPYCKIHFEGLPNVWFAEGMSDIVQLCIMSHCGGFVIANSTFSWWGAYLGEMRDPGVKIVRPKYLFAGPLLARSDSRDHWPDRWVVYDHKEPDGTFKKYDLKDVTFTIPVMYDHLDRKHNLDLNVCLLQRVFDTNIAIGEIVIGNADYKFDYMRDFGCDHTIWTECDYFHRTRMLNELTMNASTPMIANWDADVAVPEVQVIVAVEMIRKGRLDGAYPYDGRFARVPRKAWFPSLERELDLGIYKGVPFTGSVPSHHSVGGAVIWNKAKYCEIGGENEYFISHAPEDAERWERSRMLGLKIGRIKGQLFHMDHWVGPESSNRHGHKVNNDHVHHKFKEIFNSGDADKMWEWVKSWPWYENVKKGSPLFCESVKSEKVLQGSGWQYGIKENIEQ